MSKIKENSFIPGDFVVYPSHGVGKIIGTETREIDETKTRKFEDNSGKDIEIQGLNSPFCIKTHIFL